MSGVRAFLPDTEAGMDHLAELLTSGNPRAECTGRAFASGIRPAVEKFVRAELARGTDRLMILEVIADLSLQHIASIAAQTVTEGGDEAVAELATEMSRKRLVPYIRKVRAMLAAMREGGAA